MSKLITHEEYVQSVKEKHPHIEIRSKYRGKRSSITAYCTIHDYEFELKADSLLQSVHGCKYCSIDYVSSRTRKTHEEFMKELDGVINPNTIVLGKYKTAKDKIECQCRDCGNIWYPIAESLLKGYGCKKCAMRYVQNNRIKPHEQFMEEFNKRNPNHKTIKILSKYVKDDEYMDCLCTVCGKTWSAKAHSLIGKSNATGCPVCNTSKGELKVMKCLEDNDINFVWQKSYDGLVGTGGGLLSYDFYLPDTNILIEYQGEFHDGTAAYQTKEQYAYQKEHDRRKREYAEQNGITLLEIWYKDFNNVEKILEENLQLNNYKEVQNGK